MTDVFYSQSADDTRQIAQKICESLPLNTVITLSGDLGAGKTTFVKGIAEFCEISEDITSPTFNIYNIHTGSINLVHMDAYRLKSADDLDALMLDDILFPPYFFVVEWPQNILSALPAKRVDITICEKLPGEREIVVTWNNVNRKR